MEKYTVEWIPIAEITPYSKNPRKNDKAIDIVAKSISEFGFRVPIILDKDNTIIAGHTRLKAAEQVGLTELPVIRADDLTDAQVRAFRIMDNKSQEYAEWDLNLLKDEFYKLEGLPEFDWTGFNSDEISEIWDEGIEIEEDNFEIPKKAKYEVKEGQIWQLGEHRLMCGDSTEKSQVDRLMGAQRADVVYTDPPYGLGGYGGRNNMELKGDDEDVQKFYDCIPLDIKEVYIWGNFKNLMKNLKEVPRDVIVWKKNNFGLGKGYRGQYELCFYYGDFSGSDSDVWDQDKDANYEHPTQKPIRLAERAFKNSPGRNVLDLFGGSGSTLIACEQLKRKCFMMELDPYYCSVIIERWEKLTGKKAVKDGDV